jgi:hypothetical protein
MTLQHMIWAAIAAIGVCLNALPAFAADQRMVIHEWGTFTNLQDEQGNSVGGINSDDESLPPFTHLFQRQWIVGNAGSQRASLFVKGLPRCHPGVTLRLETPVLYFHPPAGWKPTPVSVHVEFDSGYLTEFFPDANAGTWLDSTMYLTRSHLDWQNLIIGSGKTGPSTDNHVWLAPRRVNAADVTAANGESERFLFYRGVGHIDAPIRIVDGRVMQADALAGFNPDSELHTGAIWFCTFLDDGRCAFERHAPIWLTGGVASATDSETLSLSDPRPSKENLARLRQQMHTALTDAGLFDDEADALLSTWELSYFKSSGTRLFYIVPREWTEHYLPLKVNVPADIVRVMVGRIDLVTPEHRRLLRIIADDPNSRAHDEQLWKTYDQLGRFRNALLLDEQRRRPTPALADFISRHGLDSAR